MYPNALKLNRLLPPQSTKDHKRQTSRSFWVHCDVGHTAVVRSRRFSIFARIDVYSRRAYVVIHYCFSRARTSSSFSSINNIVEKCACLLTRVCKCIYRRIQRETVYVCEHIVCIRT